MKKIIYLTCIGTGIFALLLIASTTKASDQIAKRQAAAEKASLAFLMELKGELTRQLKTGQPQAAVAVCNRVAPEIANRISSEHGWKVTRVGTRVRNSMLGMPDAWEQTVLKRFQKRAAKGEQYATMSYAEVVTEPGGRYFRFMKAIGVKPVCLMCHGSKDQIPAAIYQMLKKNYPHDRATGYRAGDLRGAVSIKQPMNMPVLK